MFMFVFAAGSTWSSLGCDWPCSSPGFEIAGTSAFSKWSPVESSEEGGSISFLDFDFFFIHKNISPAMMQVPTIPTETPIPALPPIERDCALFSVGEVFDVFLFPLECMQLYSPRMNFWDLY